MNDAEFAKSLFGPGLSRPATDAEAAKALFGRVAEPVPAEPIGQPVTGPVIPGQERQPDYVNKTPQSRLIDQLFNN